MDPTGGHTIRKKYKTEVIRDSMMIFNDHTLFLKIPRSIYAFPPMFLSRPSLHEKLYASYEPIFEEEFLNKTQHILALGLKDFDPRAEFEQYEDAIRAFRSLDSKGTRYLDRILYYPVLASAVNLLRIQTIRNFFVPTIMVAYDSIERIPKNLLTEDLDYGLTLDDLEAIKNTSYNCIIRLIPENFKGFIYNNGTYYIKPYALCEFVNLGQIDNIIYIDMKIKAEPEEEVLPSVDLEEQFLTNAGEMFYENTVYTDMLLRFYMRLFNSYLKRYGDKK